MTKKLDRITVMVSSLLALVPLLGFAGPEAPKPTGTIANQIDSSIYGQVARVYKCDPILIYALTLTASGRQVGDSIGPSPNLITVNGKGYNFKDRAAAAVFLTNQLALNHRNIAVGLAQINIQTFPNPTPHMLLDPFFNLVEASRLLQEMQRSTDDHLIGIGRYFTWNDDAKLWGERVADTYRNIIFNSNFPIEIASRK